MVKANRPPGMMAVARLAGVSHQTVSRVLNQPDQVRTETRQRVTAAMTELGYSPNLAARALVTQQTALLGVVWTGASFFGPARTVASLEVAARAAGYATLVGALRADSEQDVASIFASFKARGVDGIAVVTPHERMLQLVQQSLDGIPTVLVGDVSPEAGLAVVTVDQELGARLATQHLIEQGCRRILHLSGPTDWFDAKARIRGWQGALTQAGLPVAEVIAGDWSAKCGYQIAAELVAGNQLPDAIFCGNDLMALGLMAGLRDNRIAIPDRIKIVGFDDIDGAGYAAPPLTTVRQPFEQLGARCLENLVQTIEGQAPARYTVAPELKGRASSGMR